MPMLHVDHTRFSTRLTQPHRAQRDDQGHPQQGRPVKTRRQRRARTSLVLNGAALAVAACVLLALLVLAP